MANDDDLVYTPDDPLVGTSEASEEAAVGGGDARKQGTAPKQAETAEREEASIVSPGAAPEEETASPDPHLKALARIEASLAEGFDKVLTSFENRLAYDRVKEKQIDALHQEVQKQRSDLVAKATRPLALGVIRLHDDIGKMLESVRKKDPAALTAEHLLRLIEGFQEDLEIVLGQNGVEAYREADEVFNAQRQLALTSEPAPEPARVGRVAGRLRPGFERGGEILRKERVVVYAAVAATREREDGAGNGESAGANEENEDG